MLLILTNNDKFEEMNVLINLVYLPIILPHYSVYS